MDNSISAGDSVFSKISGTYINQDTNVKEESITDSYMDFDDYLQLIVAQMQNQDFNDPMDDKDIIATMSQYSMLEGIKNMTQQSAVSYASSLVGKVVTVDDGSGAYTGKVESVTVSDGTAYLMIDGEQYKSDKVTDIVNEETFNNLMSLLGYNVKKRGADDSEALGQVTNILYSGGVSYVVVGGELLPVSTLQLVSTEVPGNSSGESGEESGEENTSGDGDDSVIETAEANAAETYTSYVKTSDSLIQTFMNELDGIAAVSETSGTGTADMNEYEEYMVEMAEVSVMDLAAGIQGDFISDTLFADGADGDSGSLSREIGNVSLDDYNNSLGITTSTSTDTSTAASTSTSTSTVQYTSTGKLKGVTAPQGVATSDGVPHRISVENYPEEAALADELGTRMYDIKFIHNHAITSRIKTDEIIAYTNSGKAVTEIGYSGVGQLGEVVTFADGTQRVEVLLKNGNSCWYYTSGTRTLDEICNRNAAPGSLVDLTPEESAIRHFSHPFEGTDQTVVTNFESYLKSNATLV